MTEPLVQLHTLNVKEAASQIQEAAAARKCWPCGCLHSSLSAIEQAFPQEKRPSELAAAIQSARDRLTEVKYDCLGCEVCFPAMAVNALKVEGDNCPAESVHERQGWPPLPGDYTVCRYRAPVAVCTLTDEDLSRAVVREAGGRVAIIGTLHTENLGIERLVTNVISNPNIRFLVVCGADSRQAVGHLPGQSLVSLARSGLDERGRVIGAKGKRPILRNLAHNAVEHFQRTVELIDLVGEAEMKPILDTIEDCGGRYPGPAEPYALARAVELVRGYVPGRMLPDPAGYLVLFLDRPRGVLTLEHYKNSGALDCVIEGRKAAELYWPAIERGFVSRLDHAAYLGRELARAEQALKSGEPYVQDAAPERPGASLGSCGCSPAYPENR